MTVSAVPTQTTNRYPIIPLLVAPSRMGPVQTAVAHTVAVIMEAVVSRLVVSVVTVAAHRPAAGHKPVAAAGKNNPQLANSELRN
jgi:hypothetical protein